MKRLRRFWRRNAGLLGVLCGVALLLAAVLYLNSGRPVRMVLAEPTEPPPTRTPEWEEIMRLLKERTKTPEPTEVPEITPMPEIFYEDMYSEIRGMDGKQLFDWEQIITENMPPPGYQGRKFSKYPDNWVEYIDKTSGYLVYKGYVFSTRACPPTIVLNSEHPYSHALPWGFWWVDAIDENGEKIREKLLNVEDIDFSEAPSVKVASGEVVRLDGKYGFYEPGEGETKYMYHWLSELSGEDLVWGDWLINMRYPPPGYDVSRDPYQAFGIDDETIADYRDGDGYADVWMKFFEENPDMLYID